MNKTTPDISNFLRYALSQPPTRTGMRLRGEVDLCRMLDVTRGQLRLSIAELVNDGLLVRRHGSGTFVRRVPGDIAPVAAHADISPDEVFTQEREFGRRKLPLSQQRFILGFWEVPHQRMSRTARALANAIKQRAEDENHRLVIADLPRASFQDPVDYPAAAAALLEAQCDGHFVSGFLGPEFENHVDTVVSPAVYYMPADLNMDVEPMIMFSTYRALHRAVGKFGKLGHRRVAVVTLEQSSSVWQYRHALARIESDYDGYIAADTFHLDDARPLIRKLLSRSDRPTAIYVADDHLLVRVAEEMHALGIEPGRDIAVISMAIKDQPLPEGHDWSVLEFDTHQMAMITVDTLLGLLRDAEKQPTGLALSPQWHEGDTHRHPSFPKR